MNAPARPFPSLADGLLSGDRSALARALNLLDSTSLNENPDACELLRGIGETAMSRSQLIGITGPPGVGKSSLIASMIRHWRSIDVSVAVLAVDPSSRTSGGALLGDRLRIRTHRDDDGVFIRSLANRNTLGGLGPQIWPMCLVMLSCFDRVLVETVGIGQSEVDVCDVADTVCFVAQPASGDSVQFLKAGIMEIPDVIVVNKADLGDEATRTANALRNAGRMNGAAVERPVTLVSATTDVGIVDLINAIEASAGADASTARLDKSRKSRFTRWALQSLSTEFGTHGIKRLGGHEAVSELMEADPGNIFGVLQELRQQLVSNTIIN